MDGQETRHHETRARRKGSLTQRSGIAVCVAAVERRSPNGRCRYSPLRVSLWCNPLALTVAEARDLAGQLIGIADQLDDVSKA